MLVNKIYYGEFLYFINEKLSFDNTKYLIFPFSESFEYFKDIFQNTNFKNNYFMMVSGWNSIFVFFALIISILGIKRLKWEYSLFSILSLLTFSSLSWGISNARYVYSMFPIFIFLGLIKSRILQFFILGIFAIGLLYFTTIFTDGKWAF